MECSGCSGLLPLCLPPPAGCFIEAREEFLLLLLLLVPQALLLLALYTSVQGRPLEEASTRFSCRHKFSSVDFPVSSSLRMERINGGPSPGLVSGLEKVYDLCGHEASFHQGNLNNLHQNLVSQQQGVRSSPPPPHTHFIWLIS